MNKFSFQKQWEYVQKKLISKDILDIKFKEFFIISEGYFMNYKRLCRDNNIKLAKNQSS